MNYAVSVKEARGINISMKFNGNKSMNEKDKKIKEALFNLFKDDIFDVIGVGVTGKILLKDIKISFTAFRLDCGDDDAPDHEVDIEYSHDKEIE